MASSRSGRCAVIGLGTLSRRSAGMSVDEATAPVGAMRRHGLRRWRRTLQGEAGAA